MENLNVSKLRAVVFDWDNTLAQSGKVLEEAVNQVLKSYKLPPWSVMKLKRDNSLSFQDNFPILFGQNALAAYEKYRHIYLKIVQTKIKAAEFSYPLLSFFRKRNIPICLMTNKERKLVDFELPILFERETFDNIVCGHESRANKPDGSHLFETLRFMMEPCDISPQSVWVVGDSPQDSFCACSCGAQAIRIGTSLWNEDCYRLENCCYFDSFVDFYESLLLSND